MENTFRDINIRESPVVHLINLLGHNSILNKELICAKDE